MYAAGNGRASIVELLLQRGADWTVKSVCAHFHVFVFGFGVLCVGWLTILLCIFQSFDVVAIHCTLCLGK